MFGAPHLAAFSPAFDQSKVSKVTKMTRVKICLLFPAVHDNYTTITKFYRKNASRFPGENLVGCLL